MRVADAEAGHRGLRSAGYIRVAFGILVLPACSRYADWFAARQPHTVVRANVTRRAFVF